MNLDLKSQFPWLVLAGSAIMFLIFAFTWEGFYGGADNIAHYRISRHAFAYPHLFLDHWGKPLFTLLSAPFSQFGFTGIRVFNVIAGILAGAITLLSARKLQLNHSSLVLLFLFFAPIYFLTLPSALTEPLFSLVLILSVYFFLSGKYIFSALVLSFLPFARTEGVFLIPLFATAYIYARQTLSVLFLFTGTVLYSVAGLILMGDFFWLVHHFPYTGARDIYGSGDLLHFVKSAHQTMGIPAAILLTAGTFSVIRDIFIKNNEKSARETREGFLLIAAAFFIYLGLHSFAWWRGMAGSLGLIRVMAGVLPLAALLSLKGFNFLTDLMRLGKNMKLAIAIILSLLIIQKPLNRFRYLPPGEDEKVVAEAASWFKHSEFSERKVYYHHLYFLHLIDKDPFDREVSQEKLPNPSEPSTGIPGGSIIQWDAHFGPNEGRLPLEYLMGDPGLRLLKVFAPEVPLKTWRGDDFAVYLFERIPTED